MTAVSILTPTYERIAFLPFLTIMIESQDVDLTQVEWIVIDDSKESSFAFFQKSALHNKLKALTYVHLPQKRSVGCKRNLAKTIAKGKYLIHMDDDDYYAPNYVSTVLSMFESEHKPQLIGATKVYLMYPKSLYLYQIGPVHQRHTCGGAMSYTYEYAQKHHYKNDATKAEEAYFVNNNPVMQINSIYNINMVFVHDHNTVPKDGLKRHKINVRWIDVIQHPDVLLFYLSLHADKIELQKELKDMKYIPNNRQTYGTTFLVLTLIQSLQNIMKTVMMNPVHHALLHTNQNNTVKSS